jgi:hypothetical protein
METFENMLKTIQRDADLMKSIKEHRAVMMAQHYHDNEYKMQICNTFYETIINKYSNFPKEEVLFFVMIAFNSLYEQYTSREKIMSKMMGEFTFRPIELLKERIYEKMIFDEVSYMNKIDDIEKEYIANNWMDDAAGTIEEKLKHMYAINKARSSQARNIISWERKTNEKTRHTNKNSLKSIINVSQ